MKDYSGIIQDIKDNITENGKGEITGRDLREILLEAIGNVSVDMEELDRRIEAILGGENYDDIINSWAELEQFLSGLDESSNLAELLSYKADKSDVYSRSDINAKLEDYTKTDDLGALALKDEVEMSDIKNLEDALDKKLDKEGGEIENNLLVKRELKMGVLFVPTSDGEPSSYRLAIGKLGSGADTPEGGGSGIAQVTINVNGSPYKTDANGVVTLPNYPTSLPASDVYDWAKKSRLAASDVPDLSSSYMSINLGGIPMSTTTNLNRVGYGYVDGGWLYSGPAIAFGSSNGYTALIQQKAGDYELRVSYKNNGVASGSWKTIAFTSDLEGYLPKSGGLMGDNAGIRWSENVHSWDAPVSGLECISTTNEAFGYYAGLSLKGYYGLQIRAYGGNTDSIQVRGYDHSVWGTWRTIIHSGNIGSQSVASATKLQTARTIWGQSFDGTGNVTRTLHITEHTLNTDYSEGIRINALNGGYSSIWLNTVNPYGYDSGMWGITAMKNGNLRFRGGATALSDLMVMTQSGNVLIGTTTDSGSSKLQVNGNITAKGYQLPTDAPSNPVSGGYYLYVGTLGAGATIL